MSTCSITIHCAVRYCHPPSSSPSPFLTLLISHLTHQSPHMTHKYIASAIRSSWCSVGDWNVGVGGSHVPSLLPHQSPHMTHKYIASAIRSSWCSVGDWNVGVGGSHVPSLLPHFYFYAVSFLDSIETRDLPSKVSDGDENLCKICLCKQTFTCCSWQCL